jgi:hypothetical protein
MFSFGAYRNKNSAVIADMLFARIERHRAAGGPADFSIRYGFH